MSNYTVTVYGYFIPQMVFGHRLLRELVRDSIDIQLIYPKIKTQCNGLTKMLKQRKF